MTNVPAFSRPIGWWLKEADARLDAVCDRALAGRNVDRRGWQVLSSLARRPTPREEIVASLTAFDPPVVIQAVLSDLSSLGWIEESGGLLRLTTPGNREHADLLPLVEAVRGQVAAVLSGEDYITLVGLLERLVAAL